MRDSRIIHQIRTNLKNYEETLPFYYKLQETGSLFGADYHITFKFSRIHTLGSVISFSNFYLINAAALIFSKSTSEILFKANLGFNVFTCLTSLIAKWFDLKFRNYSKLEYLLPISDLVFWGTHLFLGLRSEKNPSLFWNILTIFPLVIYCPFISVFFYKKRRHYDYEEMRPMIKRINSDIVFDFFIKSMTYITFGYFSGTLKGKFFKFFTALTFGLPSFLTFIGCLIIGLLYPLDFGGHRRQITKKQKYFRTMVMLFFLGICCPFSLYNTAKIFKVDFNRDNWPECFSGVWLSTEVICLTSSAFINFGIGYSSYTGVYEFFKKLNNN